MLIFFFSLFIYKNYSDTIIYNFPFSFLDKVFAAFVFFIYFLLFLFFLFYFFIFFICLWIAKINNKRKKRQNKIQKKKKYKSKQEKKRNKTKSLNYFFTYIDYVAAIDIPEYICAYRLSIHYINVDKHNYSRV